MKTRKERWDGFEGPILKSEDELTSEDLAQQDFVDNTIHEMLCKLVGKELDWNIGIIHTVFNTVREELWKTYKIKIPYACFDCR